MGEDMGRRDSHLPLSMQHLGQDKYCEFECPEYWSLETVEPGVPLNLCGGGTVFYSTGIQ